MLLNCDYCGKEINKTPSSIKKKNYCNQLCRTTANHVEMPCVICGVTVRKLRCTVTKNVCCSTVCTKKYISQKLSALNRELNPGRMIPSTREKLREARLRMNLGEGKAYRKTFSRHTHRVVAEQKLGRKLLPGEIVHHKDENILNNHPDNLEILSSQSEHCKTHNFGKNRRKKYAE